MFSIHHQIETSALVFYIIHITLFSIQDIELSVQCTGKARRTMRTPNTVCVCCAVLVWLFFRLIQPHIALFSGNLLRLPNELCAMAWHPFSTHTYAYATYKPYYIKPQMSENFQINADSVRYDK